MGTTFAKFGAEYSRIMDRTRTLSQLGAFLIAMMAVVQISQYWIMLYRYSSDDSVALDFVMRVTSLQLIIAIPFGIRFLLLFKCSWIRSLWVRGSWFVALSAAILYYADSQNYWRPTSLIVYSTRQDPLEAAWVWFLFWSSVRFVITAAVSYIRIR